MVREYGSPARTAIVIIDGKRVAEVDTYSERATPLRQQRLFWAFDLALAHHSLKIINVGAREGSPRRTRIDLDAFVVTRGCAGLACGAGGDPVLTPAEPLARRDETWTLTQEGTTGVHAMQLAVVSDTHALIVDKVEHNPLTIDGHPAWAALYSLEDNAVTPLRMQSNSFCAGGTFLGNGTLVNVGGNPVVEDYTSAADFGDVDGLQAVRLFEPCDSPSVGDCAMYENHGRIRMASPRWYNTVIRINDGSAMIIGGSKKGGWMNNATVNNPTVEYYPPKSIQGSNGMPIEISFLVKTLNSNLFPIAFSLPNGKIFMAANRDAMIYDWQANTEQDLPQLPNDVRVTYPMTGTAVLLPLSSENNYTPEILICGGSTLDDRTPGYELSSQNPASSQCSRMVLDDAGIAAGWLVEYMPQARVMPDAVLLPTGQVLIVNGGATGISGYGNVVEQVGASNADYPVLTPVLYDPAGIPQRRFSALGMPTSAIPRLYHSVATLTPKGAVMIAGSNPTSTVARSSTGRSTASSGFIPRTCHSSARASAPFRAGSISTRHSSWMLRCRMAPCWTTSKVSASACLSSQFKHTHSCFSVSIMDLGYVTHAVHANSRLVYLVTSTLENGILTARGPPNGNIYPPGPGWLYIIVNGVPSEGKKVMIGSGNGPPVDQDAIRQ